MKRALLYPILSGILLLAGCGCGSGNSQSLRLAGGLTTTDSLLAGPWVADKLNTGGERTVLNFFPGTGERQVIIVAVRSSGSSYTVTDGTYSIEDNNLKFDFTQIPDLTSPFSVSDVELTVGTDVYHRSSLSGSQLGGQVQVTQETINESVSVTSASPFLPGEIRLPPALLKIQSFAAPTDLLFQDQWNLDLLRITDAWDEVTSPTPVVVAVIDSGIVSHPDLPADRILFEYGYDFVHQRIDGIPNLSLDGDGPDDDPTDPGDQKNLGLEGGSSWHETHLAGIIAASIDNGTGVAGIGRNIQILPLRAMGWQGTGTLADVAEAIRYAAKLPNIAECGPYTVSEGGGYTYNKLTWACRIDEERPRAGVINLSLGEAMPESAARPLTDAIDEAAAAGVVMVASAGNYAKGPGWCLNEDGLGFHADPSCKFFPAADPNVLSIGAVTSNLAFAGSYSNFGDTQFLVAPGGSSSAGILSTVHPSVNGGYGELIGTSQAAAHVSGVAAMVISEILSREPGISPADLPGEVRSALQTSAIDLGPSGRDDQFGWGLLNPCGAILRAQGLNPSESARLQVSSDSVNFGALAASQTVVITSGCGGVAIEGLSATVETGADWLSARLTSSTSPTQLVLTADRTGLTEGDYSGSAVIHSSSGNQTLQVTMTVGPVTAGSGDDIDDLRRRIDEYLSNVYQNEEETPLDPDEILPNFDNSIDIGEIQLLLVDAETGEPKARTITDFSSNYKFQFNGLTPGDYYLVWGIDQNGNGAICGDAERKEGEPCLLFPNAAEPEIIQITPTTKKNDLVLTF